MSVCGSCPLYWAKENCLPEHLACKGNEDRESCADLLQSYILELTEELARLKPQQKPIEPVLSEEVVAASFTFVWDGLEVRTDCKANLSTKEVTDVKPCATEIAEIHRQRIACTESYVCDDQWSRVSRSRGGSPSGSSRRILVSVVAPKTQEGGIS